MAEWYYNEFRQVGVDFSSEEEVKAYDEKYKSLRNYDEETDFIIKSLNINPASAIIEFGTGTGEHAIRLARVCSKVTVCDISEKMLEYVKKKASGSGITNIEYINGGFLNSTLQPGSYDAAVSQLALHHLPEFWKSAAIGNIGRVLKPGGLFYLLDSIMSFDIPAYRKAITDIINFTENKIGKKIAEEIIINIRDEYPSFDWTIETMLTKNGFTIEKKIKYTDIMALYISKKEK